jgi:hypothetical protein
MMMMMMMMICQKYHLLAADGTISWPRAMPNTPVLESYSVACTAGWDHPLAETAKLGSIRWPDLQTGSFDVHGAKPGASAISFF